MHSPNGDGQLQLSEFERMWASLRPAPEEAAGNGVGARVSSLPAAQGSATQSSDRPSPAQASTLIAVPASATLPVPAAASQVASSALSAVTSDVPSTTATRGKPEVVETAVELVHCWDLNVKTESFCVELVVYTRWQVRTASEVAASPMLRPMLQKSHAAPKYAACAPF